MSKQTSSNDPMVGTWKLNLSKSTYSPGPAPKSAINKFEPREDGMKATIDMVDGQGKKIHSDPGSFINSQANSGIVWKSCLRTDLTSEWPIQSLIRVA